MTRFARISVASILFGGLCAAALLNAQQTGTARVMPIASDLLVVRSIATPDGSVRTQQNIRKYYRNAEGSTRTEDGQTVVIDNKKLHKMIILDFHRNIAQEIDLPFTPAMAGQPMRPSTVPHPDDDSGKHEVLGTKNVSGLEVAGESRTVTNPKHKDMTVETWRSAALGLPIQTVVKSESATTTTTYTNLVMDSNFDDDLFVTPKGFTVRRLQPSIVAKTN